MGLLYEQMPGWLAGIPRRNGPPGWPDGMALISMVFAENHTPPPKNRYPMKKEDEI